MLVNSLEVAWRQFNRAAYALNGLGDESSELSWSCGLDEVLHVPSIPKEIVMLETNKTS